MIIGKDFQGPLSAETEAYPDGIILPINKPYRWTSADVVRKVKFAAVRHFHKKNLKVGHAGTLDPLAGGVLLICVGKATRLAERLQSSDKEYIADLVIGASTASYDLEKPIDKFYPDQTVDEERLRAALEAFRGEQEQAAPIFSAKLAGGKRGYEIARKLYAQAQNESVERVSEGEVKTCETGMKKGLQVLETGLALTDAENLLRKQKIKIHELELLDFADSAASSGISAVSSGISAKNSGISDASSGVSSDGSNISAKNSDISDASSRINVEDISGLQLPRARLRIRCSKGTYIRALARDLGLSTGGGAFLAGLLRTENGGVRLENCLSMEEALKLFTK